MSYINKLKEVSAVISNAKALNNDKKSASNIASAVGFFAILSGKLRDAEEVKNAVSKDGDCNVAKAAVSKGQTLAKFFLDDGEIAVTTEEQGEVVYNKDSFAGASLENLPSIAFGTLYTYVKKAEKEAKTFDAVEHNARLFMEDTHNLPLAEIKALLGDEQYAAQWENALLQARETLEAEEANKDNVEQIKLWLDTMTEGQRLVIADYIASLADSEVKEAKAA